MASDTAYSPSPSPIVRNTTQEENHRKRRRNRTRVSCLNCYASKRKCDRKRPCTRCINHGLTGLCYYELADPAACNDSSADETTRLRRRIAELESVVRAMNNRPHPRWTAPDGLTHRATRTRRTTTTTTTTRSSPSSSSGNASPAATTTTAAVDAFFAAEAEVKVKLEPEHAPPEFTPSQSSSSSASPAPPAPPAAASSSSASSSSSLPLCCSPFGSPLTPLLPDQAIEPDPPPHGAAVDAKQHCWSPSSEEGTLPLLDLCGGGIPVAGAAAAHASVAVQTSPPPPPQSPPPHPPPPSTAAPCDCLASATLHSPLVYFASALRASRETLARSHHAQSTCFLFRRIVELDEHIFSVAPLEQSPTPDPGGGGGGGGGIGPGENALQLSTPSPTMQDAPPPPALAHLSYPHDSPYSPCSAADALAFLDMSLYPLLDDWS